MASNFPGVVGSRAVENELVVRLLPRGLLPRNVVSALSIQLSGAWLAQNRNVVSALSLKVLGWPTVNCFVPRAVYHW